MFSYTIQYFFHTLNRKSPVMRAPGYLLTDFLILLLIHLEIVDFWNFDVCNLLRVHLLFFQNELFFIYFFQFFHLPNSEFTINQFQNCRIQDDARLSNKEKLVFIQKKKITSMKISKRWVRYPLRFIRPFFEFSNSSLWTYNHISPSLNS